MRTATQVRALALGLGARSVLIPGSVGRVAATFQKACYLEFPEGLVALVGSGVHPGPIHVQLERDPPRVREGSNVAATPEEIRAGELVVETAGAPVWRGALPAPASLREAAERVADIAAGAAGSTLAPREAVTGAAAAIRGGDLRRTASHLVGRGPGLTPSGDDILAGILFAIRAGLGPSAEARTVPVADAARTTRVSRAFLAWAARGQGLGPLHDLVCAAAAGDGGRATAAAAALSAVGESSGADLALGLRLGIGAVGVEPGLFEA